MRPSSLAVLVIALAAGAGIIWAGQKHSRPPAVEAPEQVESKVEAQMRASYIARKEQYDADVVVLNTLRIRWIDATAVASRAPRMVLAQPVLQLQQIRRDTSEVLLSECPKAASANLVRHMDSTIEGYLLFMSEPNELLIRDPLGEELNKAAQAMADFEKALAECTPEKPHGVAL